MRSLALRTSTLLSLLAPLLASAGVPYFDEHQACEAKHGLACHAFVASEKTVLREKPKLDSELVVELQRGDSVWLLSPAIAGDGPAWLRSVVVAPTGATVPAWARRTDLATATEFFRVVGCWPVARVEYQSSDEYGEPYRQILRFDVRGRVHAEGPSGRNPALFGTPKGMFVVVAEAVSEGEDQTPIALTTESPLMVLDSSHRRVSFPGEALLVGAPEEGSSPTFQARPSPAGCASGPTLDPSVSLLTWQKRWTARNRRTVAE